MIGSPRRALNFASENFQKCFNQTTALEDNTQHLATWEEEAQKLSLVERALSNKEVVARTLKALKLGKDWTRLDAQSKLYHYFDDFVFNYFACMRLKNQT